MNNATVSVIVPLYNGAAVIERCVHSIVAQTVWPAMEIIIVDDGSTDGSCEIADRLAAQHPRITVQHIPNGGVSNARNTGLAYASGTYVGFVDADDWIDADGYERLLAAAQDGQADVVSAGFYIETAAGTMLEQPTAQEAETLTREEAVRRFLCGGLDVHIVTKLFKRSVLQDVRFDASIAIAEDRLFVFEALMNSADIRLVPGCFYRYYMNENSAMHQGFSVKSLGDLTVSERMMATVQAQLPALLPYAACMDINARCRVLTKLVAADNAAEFAAQRQELTRQVRRFPLLRAWKYASKKHFVALLLTKLSPTLVERIKKNPTLRYKR